jgi:two-component system response regulator HydG
LLESRDFALVISDVRMAGMNGVELFRRLKRTRPETPVVLMTAFTVEYLIKEAEREGIFTVLPKPVDFDYLASTIQRALRRPLVLFVDDDESVTESTVGVCERAGLRVMAALDAEAALEALKKRRSR